MAVRIVFFLRNLQTGGAERQFLQIIAGLAARGHEVRLVTRTPGGALSPLLSPAVPRHVLQHAPGTRAGRVLELARTPGRLRRLVRELAPDVVYTALYVNDALAHRALLAHDPPDGTGTPLVWGFRNAAQPLSRLRGMAMDYTRRHAPDVPLAVFNCRSGEQHLRDRGFRLRRTVVIPNGVDVAAFHPAPEAGRAFRASLGIPAGAVVVGNVGRLHPMKDHGTFLAAAAVFARKEPRARFVCLGDGAPGYTVELRRRADKLGLGERVHWVGTCDDPCSAYNAFDLVASTSVAEGFPNALSEALSCERPCVASDVGDCDQALGLEGTLVPAGDPRAQAEAWTRLLSRPADERRARGARARRRIAQELSLERCAQRTEEALSSVIRG